MSDDIPFNKTLDLAPDTVDEPMPGVRRIMANNPGPFTFKGTLSYIIGHGKVAIVDPGPGRSGAYRRAARRRAQRDRDAYLRHPYPPRSFAGGAGDQARPPAPPSMPKARTAPRGRCISASTIRSIPAATAISGPT